ncbi:YheC/YheD family protein [Halalkalibacterium halodurans]|uniref:YheC/YheD family endospore coat-associated protein n=1 Tax=Halalkalibacterium halodurans TaxID=86665 RepID=UPI0010673466|nr:YheC/YheD family protein [Halalkalibacterium halodurans]MED3647479.1 YheC/YheD family protein [Halalkalibacterium halodurans]TES57970.1 YheC/YheD family protein [Halalkalibacterium halodurans]
MSKLLFPLKKHVTSKGTLFAASSLFKRWVDTKRFPNEVSFGQQTCTIQVAPHPDHKEELLLSADLWDRLRLPYEQHVSCSQQLRTLCLAPLIGIFTAGFHSSTYHPLGSRSSYFANLLSAAEEEGVFAFLFGNHHVNKGAKTIEGLTFTDGKWRQETFPWPNAVYDRIPARKVAALQDVQEVRHFLEDEQQIPWFNVDFFNKWDLYTKLKNHRQINVYIPESLLNPSLEELERMLDDYKHVYLKPVEGSFGAGIHQIIRPDNDPYVYCRFHENGGNRLRRYSSLKRCVANQFPQSLQQMIAQQGIKLFTLNDHPIDFRIHTNKNKRGTWIITAIAAKIAGEGSITTHLKTGGEIRTVQEILDWLPEKHESVKRLKKAALQLSLAIDESLDGFIGEIGFDLGLDESGRVWLLEANSKPGRAIFRHPNLQKEERETLRLPFHYGTFLAKHTRLEQLRVIQA